MEYFELLFGLTTLLVIAYYYFTSTFDFWSSREVPGPKPIPVFGNLKDFLLAKISLHEFLAKDYKVYENEPMWGIYDRRTPMLVIKDPEYIKDVLIKDFTVFSDRGQKVFERVEPLSQHLFQLEPERWRPLRTKLSPAFTSGKLKDMFYLLVECANHFEEFLKNQVAKNPIIESRDISAKYTTDVIGMCAFGLKMNSLEEDDSDFRKFGRKIFDVPFKKLIKIRFREALPGLYNLLKPIMYDHEINDFFINTMAQTIDYRKKNGVKRNDFVDLLINIRENPSKLGDIEMTDVLMTAQAFVFFVAGFETSSSTMSNALYELAQNHSVQNKLREEIKNELENNNGEIKYESIKNMKYMNKVFSETLRKYPPVSTITRRSTAPYTFSGTKVTIPKGLKIFIPAYALQRDPKIYPDPDVFDPERFDDENVKTRHPSFYLPFGDGPRNCIGARFAHYQTKVGLMKIIKNYHVDVCDKTTIPYKFNPRNFLLTPIAGIKLKFTKVL